MSSQNVGEELVGAYLQVIKGCEFVSYNLSTPDVQGEIDVVALNRRTQTLYVCEVAVHLSTGLQYTSNGQPDNVTRIVAKFNKDIDYAEKRFADYERVYMLWSPIVRDTKPGSKHNQLHDVQQIRKTLSEQRGIDLQLIVNEKFQSCLKALRAYARAETKELKSPPLRLLQIEETLRHHLLKMDQSK